VSTLDKDDVAAIAAAVDALQHHPEDHHADGTPKVHTRDVKKRITLVVVVMSVMYGADHIVHLEFVGRGAEWVIAAFLDWWFNAAKEARASEKSIKDWFKRNGG
jgi:hypothetical protein